MFGFGKKPLTTREFNNIFVSYLTWVIVDTGTFPASKDLQIRVNAMLPDLKAKLTAEQEKSIALIDHLMPSQKSVLMDLAKATSVEMSSGNETSFNNLTRRLQSYAVLSSL